MRRRISLVRSTLVAVFIEPRKAVLRLSPAYVETAEDHAAVGATTGFQRDVVLEVYEPGPHAVLQQLPAGIRRATLHVDQQHYTDHVPLPMVTGGEIRLRLETNADEILTLSGRGIAAIFFGRRDLAESSGS